MTRLGKPLKLLKLFLANMCARAAGDCVPEISTVPNDPAEFFARKTSERSSAAPSREGYSKEKIEFVFKSKTL